MKSLYKRQLFMMVAIVFLSFFMLSAAFMMLSYRYIIAEKRDAMERNADYIASFTSEYIQQSGSLDVYFRSYVATLASVSDSNVLLSDVDGDIIYASGGSSSDLSNYTDSRIPPRVLQQVLSSGSYNGLTNLDGIYSEKRYLAAYPFGIIFGGATIPQGLRDVACHRHHLFLYRCDGAAHRRDRQFHHLLPSGPSAERDGRGRPEIRAGGVRRAGHRL